MIKILTRKNGNRVVLNFLILLLIAFTNCKKLEKQTDRPMENWVFRSVLDKKPRALTVALHKNMWLAYDTENGTLFKAWSGDVVLDGAVYTTKHGPQPTSYGYQYLTNTQEKWMLKKGDELTSCNVQYNGHRFKGEEVFINRTLITQRGKQSS